MGDPATTMAIASSIASVAGPTLSQLFAPDDQQLSSFEGRGRVDPVSMLSQANYLINQVGRGVSNRAAQPISLPSSFVQQPGAYTGGGLPMPIGLVASDPALANPSLLGLPGMEDFQGLFDHIDDWQSVDDRGNPGQGGGDKGGSGERADGKLDGGSGDIADDKADRDGNTRGFASTITPAGQSVSDAISSGPRRRSASGGNLVRAADLMEDSDGTADLDQGYGAAQLLLDAIQGGATQRTGARL